MDTSHDESWKPLLLSARHSIAARSCNGGSIRTWDIFQKITPKAGEAGLIVGFLIGMARLLTNIFTNTGKDVMTGQFWESTTWFWHTNWLIFEIWLLVFIMLFMVVVSFFTKNQPPNRLSLSLSQMITRRLSNRAGTSGMLSPHWV